MPAFTIGLDYGTGSVRAILVNTSTGKEIATAVFNYPRGKDGVMISASDPNLARQHPADYHEGAITTVRSVLKQAAKHKIKPEQVVGIGVDTTGSTPIPVDAAGVPLAFDKRFKKDVDALAWLWKDHTAHAEAEEITAAAARSHPEYLAKIGGRYSSEWFWAKLLHCARVAPKVFAAAHTWVEFTDYVPALLCGTTAPSQIRRGICAAGHKAFDHESWGGYADAAFLKSLHPGLARVRETLPEKVYTAADRAGTLSAEWAKKLGLPQGIPVAVGAFDVHLGAVGSGIAPGTLVKIMGTSTCDLVISPTSRPIAEVPGICGIVPGSVIPDFYGMEAGQSAVGDIFNWFVSGIAPGGPGKADHRKLSADAAKLKPGESGLLALDWHNGNRTILVDQRLTGLILGLTLHSSPAEIYRALIEATALGARVIMERYEEYCGPLNKIVNGGGIAAKNPLAMQIYADIMGRTVATTQSEQTCALGSAIAGAVVAGKKAGGYDTFAQAISKMASPAGRTFTPNKNAVRLITNSIGSIAACTILSARRAIRTHWEI